MRKKKIRIPEFVIVFCLLTLLLNGCKKSDIKTENTNSQQTTQASSSLTTIKKTTTKTTAAKLTTTSTSKVETNNNSTPVESDDRPEDQVVEEYGGGTIEEGPFAGLKFDVSSIDGHGRTFIVWNTTPAPIAGNSESEDRILATYAKVEKKFNVKIEYKQSTWWPMLTEIKSSWMAGIKWADYPYIYSWIMPWGLTEKLFKPVDDYIDFSHERYRSIEQVTRWIDGKHYSYKDNLSDTSAWMPATFYNVSILEREGLEDILDLYKLNQWTWEKFRDYGLVTTRDLNGDGVIDQWGIGEYGIQTDNGLVTMLRYSNTVVNASLDFENGTINFRGFDRAYLNVLQFYQTLKHVDKIVTNQNPFIRGNGLMVLAPSIFRRNYYNNDLPVKQAPTPVGPDAAPNSAVRNTINSLLVPAVTDFTTEEIIAIGTYLSYNDPDDPDTYVDPYVEWMENSSNTASNFYIGSDEERNFFYDYMTNVPVIAHDSILGNDFNAIIGPYLVRIGNGESVSSVLESARQAIDSYIQSVIKK